MDVAEVLAVYDLLDEHGVEIWLDGGWGVDALLGEQTRPHGDLDIAVRHADVPRLRQLLGERAYRASDRPGDRSWNFVLVDPSGNEIDVHSFTRDAAGDVTYGIEYPVEALTGTGRLGGHDVRCIALESVIAFRCAYDPRPRDVQDMQRLWERFRFDLPPRYRELLGME